jgi:hypothetical protein
MRWLLSTPAMKVSALTRPRNFAEPSRSFDGDPLSDPLSCVSLSIVFLLVAPHLAAGVFDHFL